MIKERIGMYEKLTDFIPKLNGAEYGKWHTDDKGDGTLENPFHMPFVIYSEVAVDFAKAVSRFGIENSDLGLTDYMKVLEPQRENGGRLDISRIDVSSLDGRTTAALIVAIVRQDRFCDGLLLDNLESGLIQKCLCRLKEIDDSCL